MRLATILLAVAVVSQAYIDNYEGYKVFEVIPRSEHHQKILDFLQSDSSIDFWSESRMLNHKSVIMVKPSMINDFVKLLILNNIEYKEIISNVASTLDNKYSLKNVPRNGQINHEEYHRYDTINAYLRRIADTYSEIVTLFSIGKSTEGREILGIKISSGGSNKPAILMDAGIHAREWISPATTLYLIEQLVERPSNSDLYKTVDWYIIPLLNPDGYEYTHTTKRLWRKTRSHGVSCDGVDANRNFDFHWGEKGSSTNECSETYSGPRAYSEPEIENFANFALAIKENVKLYITVHSYGQYLLYPWGYTSDDTDDVEELRALGEAVNNAIKAVSGTEYTIGSSANALYVIAGSSKDWMRGVAGVKLSYTIELPGGGANGFDPPPTSILGVARETFEGFKVFAKYVSRKWAL